LPKLELPRFFTGQTHRKQVFGKLKLIGCPHCGQSANLIRNGLLYGNDSTQQGTARIERGQRIRCSNRAARHGCGHSFAIYEAQALPGRSIGSDYLAALLAAILKHAGCVHQAWLQGTRWFSLSTAYRLWKAFRLEQSQLRHRLCRQIAPPPCRHDSHPALQLIAHLFDAFDSHPVEAYHKHFQRSVLPGCRVHPATIHTM